MKTRHINSIWRNKMAWVIIMFMVFILCLSSVSAGPFSDVKIYENAITSDMPEFIKEDFNTKYGVIRVSNTFFWIETSKIAEYSLTKNTEYCIINCEAEGKVKLYSDNILFDNVKFTTLRGKQTSIISSEYLLFDGYKDNYVDSPVYEKVCTGKIVNGTEYCYENLTRYEKVNKPIEIWTKYDGGVLLAGEYRWKIHGVKNKYQSVDFIPIMKGMEFSEWATWAAGLNSGLVAYYTLNETSGTVGLNSVTSKDNITHVGGPAFIGGLIGGATGYTNAANYSTIADSATFNFNGTGGQSNFSISLWANTTDIDRDGFVLSRDDEALGRCFSIRQTADGSGSWVFDIFSGANNYQAKDAAYTQHKWTHLVAVYNTETGISNLTLYINGNWEANVTGAAVGMNHCTGLITIGEREYSGSPVYFIGMVDEIGFWNRTLTPSEITDLYNGGVGITYDASASSDSWDISVTQVSPANAFKANYSSIDFSFLLSPINLNLTNWTFNLWNTSSYLVNQSVGYSTDATCQQETANVSTSCGGLNTGTYSTSGTWDAAVSTLYDGNYNTGACTGAVANTGYLYVNYTTPYKFVGAFVNHYSNIGATVRNNNFTIPSNCTTGNKIALKYADDDAGGKRIRIYCYDGSAYNTLINDSGDALYYNCINEESIYWNYTLGGKNTTIYTRVNLLDGSYLWNANGCGNMSNGTVLCDETANRTLSIDTIFPNATITYPNTHIGYGYTGKNISLGYNISDKNLDTTGCGFLYNGKNNTLNCSLINSSFILSTNKSFALYANDTYGNFKFTRINLSYIAFENAHIYNKTTYDTSNENFALNITYNSSIYGATANLVYNGTTYTGTEIAQGYFSRSIDIPTVTSVTNKTFYWALSVIDLTNGTNYLYNSTTNIQNISQALFTYCNDTYTTIAVNYTIYNETSLDAVESSFEATFQYFYGSGTVKKNSSVDLSGNSSYTFCILPNATYYVDANIKISASGYLSRNYFLNDEIYSNTNKNKSLYLLDGTGRNVILEFRDVNLNPLANYYIETLRKYDSLGYDIPIHIDKTDTFGQIVENLVENTVKYKFRFYNSSNGLIKSTDNYVVVACRYDVCVITFVNEESNTVLDYNNLSNYDYSLSFNNNTNTFIYSWNDNTGESPHHRLLVERTSFGGNTIVCNTSSTSLIGSLTCVVGSNYSSYRAQAFRYSSPERRVSLLNIQVGDITAKFGIEGILWSFFLLMMLIVVGIWYPPAAIALYLAGFILLKAVGIIYAPPALIIGEIAVGVAFIWAFRG